jgi:hypothetical protein
MLSAFFLPAVMMRLRIFLEKRCTMSRICATNALLTMDPLVFAIQRAHRYNAFSVELIEAQVPFLSPFRQDMDRKVKLTEALVLERE